MAGLFESVGAQPKNPSRGKAITPALRFETGLVTNRSALHDTAQWVYSHFYGGYQDTLFSGLNMEISEKLTLVRRPGASQWSSVAVPNQPNWFYDWQTLDQGIQVVVDTPAATYIQTSSTQNQIFTKSAGAGQGYYQGVGDVLYEGDGIDLQKYILPAGAVWNWGIVPPTVAPTLKITETASSSVLWQANTVWSTMGLLVDSNGNIQQLQSVNAQPVSNPNTTQFGTSGNGNPAWNQTPGGTTPDNGWNWTNFGPIVLWTPHTTYNNASVGGTLANPCIIFDPNTGYCFINANPSLAQGTSGLVRPHFPTGFGSTVQDGSVKWFNLGSLKTPQAWQKSHVYPSLGHVSNDDSVSGISEPAAVSTSLANNQTVYWQVNNTGSSQTSAASFASPAWSTVTGALTTPDGQLTWMCLGSGTRQTTHSYNAWSAMGTPFSVIVDSNNNYQVCTTSGISSATATGSITWATGYGQTTVDGTVTWTCVGLKMTWAASTIWYLPTTGWFPPSGSIAYGGAIIVDSNNNLQAVTISGLGGSSAPAWATTPVGASTVDNNATWALVGPASSQGFAWTKGFTLAYSYTARLFTDQFNFAAGTVINGVTYAGAPPDWPSPLGVPSGAETGHVSTASPLATITGANPGAAVSVTMPCSPDPQVDTITIWCTLDGGSTLFFLTEVPNIEPIGGVQQSQTVIISSSPFAALNELIQAPINGQNNPPPAGFKPMAYHFERIWGAVGNFVFCSGGPDVLTGDPNESFDPEDFFEFPAPVTRIVPTATGILVFLTSDVYAILGGPIFDTFFPSPMVPGIGLLNFNALDIHGGVIYMFTADNQFIAMDPSGGAQRMGGAIADQLQNFPATKAFVTVHESGNDHAIFISDGSTGWFRLNPSQAPNGVPVWSLQAFIVGGAGAVQSIQVTPGVHYLLIGGIGTNSFILKRDLTTFLDNGTPYICNAVLGSLMITQPGQIAGLTFVNVRAVKVGTAPAVGFLLNEISGSFTPFPSSQPYPWQVFGGISSSNSLYANAYYFRAAGIPALAEHLQVQISFPAENFQNEVLTISLFGVVEQAPEE